MPELPEVETVKESLKRNIIGKKISNVDITNKLDGINYTNKIFISFHIFLYITT